MRKRLLGIRAIHEDTMADFHSLASDNVDQVVSWFYAHQASVPEIREVIQDDETLARLQKAMRSYILQMFGGTYDQGYVNTRLRIGQVHARIGVTPTLYISMVHELETRLIAMCQANAAPPLLIESIRKFFLFDLQLVFDTYIQGLLTSVEEHRDALADYAKTLEKKVDQRTRELEVMARTDALTGLLNRGQLLESIDRRLATSTDKAAPLAVLFFDLDGLKAVNDEKGHVAGDEMIACFAKALLATARRNDLCFRYGGDEFCVLLPGADAKGADRFCERLSQSLAGRVAFSFGVTVAYPEDGWSGPALLESADQRMLVQKRARRPQGRLRSFP